MCDCSNRSWYGKGHDSACPDNPETVRRVNAAFEILEKLHEWYAASDTGPYRGSLIFEDDRTFQEHVADALGAELDSHV